jgi:hypothetical protein
MLRSRVVTGAFFGKAPDFQLSQSEPVTELMTESRAASYLRITG